MDLEAHRDLKLLEAVQQDSRVTQRRLASQLGIALGLANIYLKRLVRKGYIKCVEHSAESHLLPDHAARHRREGAPHLRVHGLLAAPLQRGAAAPARHAAGVRGRRPRVAIFGRGEAAELAYLSLKESGLEPVAIFDGEGGPDFLGMPVRPIAEHVDVHYDLMIVATLDKGGQHVADLLSTACRRETLSAPPRARRPGAPQTASPAAHPREWESGEAAARSRSTQRTYPTHLAHPTHPTHLMHLTHLTHLAPNALLAPNAPLAPALQALGTPGTPGTLSL